MRCPQDYSISLLSRDSVCKCAQYSCYIHVGSKPKQKQWTSFLAHTRILPTTLKTFSPAHTHIPLFTLETSSLPHTHILPATDIFSCTHTHILLFMLETSFLEYTNILLALLQMFFCCTYAHTSCVAICIFSCTYPRTVLDAARETSFLAHTQGGKKRCALKNLVPVKPNRMLQWVFKIPGLFKVQF